MARTVSRITLKGRPPTFELTLKRGHKILGLLDNGNLMLEHDEAERDEVERAKFIMVKPGDQLPDGITAGNFVGCFTNGKTPVAVYRGGEKRVARNYH